MDADAAARANEASHSFAATVRDHFESFLTHFSSQPRLLSTSIMGEQPHEYIEQVLDGASTAHSKSSPPRALSIDESVLRACPGRSSTR